jgi:copper(I)-binding protein
MSNSIRLILGALAVAILAWVAYSYVTRSSMDPHMGQGVTVGQFTVSGAYARGSGNSGKAGAAFFTLTNNGDADLMIGASVPIALMSELHTHIETAEGIMQMRQIEGGVAVDAGQTIKFKRGGDHVMMMGLTAPLDQGLTVPVTLIFERAGELTFDVIVDNDRKTTDHSTH